jgi:hypothetical protein
VARTYVFVPHLLHILKDHVAVTVKCFDTYHELVIVARLDEDFDVIAHSGLQE